MNRLLGIGAVAAVVVGFLSFKKGKMDFNFSAEENENCVMCGLSGNFKVEDLPVGPRWFCTEKHFAQYAGLPVKEFGYYGLDRIEYEDSGDEPEYGWEDDEYEAESKKRKRGFRKCSKCGDRGHNAPKCENPQYYEALARKEEMLDHVDYAIKEFTKDAKEYSLNRRYDMAKMRIASCAGCPAISKWKICPLALVGFAPRNIMLNM